MADYNFMPGSRVQYKGSRGVVTARGAEKGKGYFVTVKFKTMLGSKETKFWNADIEGLKKV